MEVVTAPQLEAGISQESHEIRLAGIGKRRVLPVKEEEEESSEDEVEEKNKAESSRTQIRKPPVPKLNKGKGRAPLLSPSSSEDERDQLIPSLPVPGPALVRTRAAPPTQPTFKELEERRAQAIAKKKSQIAQATLRNLEPSVDRPLRPVKQASSSKSTSKSTTAAAKNPVTSTSTGANENRRVDTRIDDNAEGMADVDMPPLRKKPASRQAANPRVDLRRITSASSTSKPKSNSRLRLALPATKPALVTEPLLSLNTRTRLQEYDNWVTETERRARAYKVAHTHAKEKEKEKGADRLIRDPLFADSLGDPVGEEVQKMYDEFVDFDGNADGGVSRQSPAPAPSPAHATPVDPAPAVLAPQPQPSMSPSSRRRRHQQPPLSPPTPSVLRTHSGSLGQGWDRDDSYRKGVVPETETEESSNNTTQSQSQSQPQMQHLKPAIESSPVPSSSTIPEVSLVENGVGEGARPGRSGSGSGSGPQRNGMSQAVVVVAEESSKKKSGAIMREATLPDLNPTADAVANGKPSGSGSGSGSGLQKNGSMTPKLVSRMKPRTPGSMSKLGVGVNGKGKGKALLLSLALEDEHHMYVHYEKDFQDDGGMDAMASPLQARSSPAPAPMTTTQDSNIADWSSPTVTTNANITQPSPSPPGTTLPTTTVDKLLRPIPLISPSKFKPHLPPTSSISNVGAEVDEEEEEHEVEALMSSIEQFSSPDKATAPWKLKRKRIGMRLRRVNEHNGEESLPPVSSLADNDDEGDRAEDKNGKKGMDGDVDGDEDFAATIRKRGVEMAEQVRRKQVRREKEEGRRASKKKRLVDFLRNGENETAKKKEAVEGHKTNGKEKESASDKDKDDSSRRQDEWFASALETWPLGNRGSGGMVSEQPSLQVQDTGKANEDGKSKDKERAGSAMTVRQKVAELEEEEEESTQDLLMEAQEHQGRGLEEVDVEMGQDLVVQQGGEEPGQDQEQEQERRPEPEPEKMVEDVQEAPHLTTADKEPQPEENTAHKASSSASSEPKSKADSNQPAVHEEPREPELVLPATASSYHHTPEPSPDVTMKDAPEHLGAAMAILNAKSLEIAKLDSMLVAEQAKTEALSIEVNALHVALVTASSGPRPRESDLELELAEAREAVTQEKAAWATERNSILASIEELKRAKQNVQNDCDFFRDQYGQASAFVTSVRKENVELEERTRTAEEQTKTGVELVRATFVQRVQWLEDDARMWRATAQHLIEMDKRTKGEELRKRAGEAPELRKKCAVLEEKNEVLSERLEELEDELEAKVREEEEAKRLLTAQLLHARNEDELTRQAELETWRNETLRLNVELNEMNAELERMKADAGSGKLAVGAQANPSDHEMVYRCQWRPEGSNDACEGLFLSIEELQNHLFSGGHLHR